MATQEQRTQAATDAVLAAAMGLFGDDGFLATSLSSIASHAGVSKSGLLHHFGTKDEVFRQVFHRAEQELVARSVGAIDPDADPQQQLRVGARALLDALADPRLRQIVLIDGPAVLGWKEWRDLEAAYAHGLVVAVLEEAHARGELAVPPTETVAAMLLAALHEAAFVTLERSAARAEVDAVLDRFLSALFVG